MSFEKEFPSLKDHCHEAVWYNMNTWVVDNIMVGECCLDKQKVKEIIDSFPEVETQGGKSIVCSKSYLFERLGL